MKRRRQMPGRTAAFPRMASLLPLLVIPVILSVAGSGAYSGIGTRDAAVSSSLRMSSPDAKSSVQGMRVYPHIDMNGAGCQSCHFADDQQVELLPDWAFQPAVDNDDTPYNNLCRHCHNDIEAPYVKTHSSLTTSPRRGPWSMECRRCHNPHRSDELIVYGADSYLHSGIVSAVSDNVLSTTGAGWTDNQYAGCLVVPNASDGKRVYRIGANGANALYVDGPIDLNAAAPGNTFAIILGKNIKGAIDTPSGGTRTVRYFRRTGANSFADGDAAYDGVCEVCHTRTTHFQCNGGGSDQHHTNQGSVPGTRCTNCHSHVKGFMHGGGSGSGCGDASSCHGLGKSHPRHVGGGGSQMSLACSDCHNPSSFPLFADNQNLANTTVCNPCHSPGGSYNGVSDAGYGAKSNWDNGVYTDNLLRTGKEKWCASCHDESPSVIGGVAAPNVVGNESGSYAYGTGWGFYKTGHGVPAGETLPYKGGFFPPLLVGGAARPLGCDACHDFAAPHLDNVHRTYGTQGFASTAYRLGYRLKRVGGQEPMAIPKTTPATGNAFNDYLLCLQCHDSGNYLNSTDNNSNFSDSTNTRRQHYNHLSTISYFNTGWTSDWRGAQNSRISCPQCHNVHGSQRLAMLNDGSLAGTPPGIRRYYYNNALSYRPTGTSEPVPPGIPLPLRDGYSWFIFNNSDLGCAANCHGASTNRIDRVSGPYPGQVPNVAPTLAWTGETGYTADGVTPDSAVSGSRFIFRVSYADQNNNLPSYIRVLIDPNNDGIFEDTYTLTPADNVVGPTYRGRIYTKTLTLNNTGGSVVRYTFDAADNAALPATGPPTGERTLSLLNNAPVLSWTGEPNFASDGVNPNTGGSGASFAFRVRYADTDGDCPDANGVRVTINGTPYALSPESGTCGAGMIYSGAVAISAAGDYPYRFSATDTAGNPATGSPASDHTLTVLSSPNTPPVLEWVAEGCRTDGVKPVLGLTNGDFEFKVKYTDIGNQCPASGSSGIQVWIDLDDSGTYAPGEMFNLTEEAAGGCTTGKNYRTTRQIPYAGNGVLNYRFYASNGTVDAIGDPAATDKNLTVVSSAAATGVRPAGGGAPWYTTIQAAVDAVPQNGTVLVYPGTYANIVLNNTAPIDTGKTVRSVCGPDLTVISGAGVNDSIWLQADNVTIDGFGITGSNRYGLFTNTATSSYTVRNSKIYNCVNNALYAQYASTLTIDNTEVYSNTAAQPGAGVRVTNTSNLILRNSYIHNNTATAINGDGGGLYMDVVANASISNTVISGNSSARSGGGVGVNTNTTFAFDNVAVTGNTAATTGGGISTGISGNSLTLAKSAVTGNSAGTTGGGIYLGTNTTAALSNSLVANNAAGTHGGGFSLLQSNITINNSTIAFNRANGGNGGMFYLNNFNSNSATIRNSIVWGNSASGSGQISAINNFSAGVPLVHFYDSIIPNDNDFVWNSIPYFDIPGCVDAGGYMGYGDPMFVDSELRNYHLLPGSPAIDRADPGTATSVDLDNVTRPQGSAPDIGCYEYRAGGPGYPYRFGGTAGGAGSRGRWPAAPAAGNGDVLDDTYIPADVLPAP